MVERPLVSVVIPCYRQAHLLPAALESVFAQTYSAVEIVVVNDGSDDYTHEVAHQYLHRITYIHQANAGLPAARNAGIEAASGDFLLFLDADDLLHPSAIAWHLEALQGRTDAIAACGHETFTDQPGEANSRAWVPADSSLFPQLIHTNIGPPHAFLVPRRMVNQVGRFNTSLRSCEDWDLWIRLAITGVNYVLVPRVGAYYRRSPGSMSTNQPRMLATRAEVLLHTVAGFRAVPELLSRWGGELALAVQRVRRKLRVQRVRPDLVAALSQVECDLTGQGFPAPVGGKETIANVLLGRDLGERLLLWYYSWRDPQRYRRYVEGYN